MLIMIIRNTYPLLFANIEHRCTDHVVACLGPAFGVADRSAGRRSFDRFRRRGGVGRLFKDRESSAINVRILWS